MSELLPIYLSLSNASNQNCNAEIPTWMGYIIFILLIIMIILMIVLIIKLLFE